MNGKMIKRILIAALAAALFGAGICAYSSIDRTGSAEASSAAEPETITEPSNIRPVVNEIPTAPYVYEPPVTELPRPCSADFIGAEPSPNAGEYLSSFAVAGDSIASGFYHYGLIDHEHNIAQSAVSIWNLDYFTYDYGTGELDTYEAAALIKPKILYFSVGMNDVNMLMSDEYAVGYKKVIKRIRRLLPDTVIITAAITPIYDSNDFIDNSIIREFNSALENMVDELDDDHVWYFDAYSVVADSETLALADDNSAGDGMHLAQHCYQELLDCLFSYLDATPVRNMIIN